MTAEDKSRIDGDCGLLRLLEQFDVYTGGRWVHPNPIHRVYYDYWYDGLIGVECEDGFSVTSAWLTPLGEHVRTFLRTLRDDYRNG